MSPAVKMRRRLAAAKQRVKDAQAELRTLTKELLPVGTLVTVELGRALVEGEVIDHTYEPDGVKIRNLSTSKDRKFNAAYHQWELS